MENNSQFKKNNNRMTANTEQPDRARMFTVLKEADV